MKWALPKPSHPNFYIIPCIYLAALIFMGMAATADSFVGIALSLVLLVAALAITMRPIGVREAAPAKNKPNVNMSQPLVGPINPTEMSKAKLNELVDFHLGEIRKEMEEKKGN